MTREELANELAKAERAYREAQRKLRYRYSNWNRTSYRLAREKLLALEEQAAVVLGVAKRVWPD